MIAPYIAIGLAIIKWSNTFFPMIDIVYSVTMQHTASWKAHKLWTQGCNCLGNILTHAMPFIGIVRKK